MAKNLELNINNKKVELDVSEIKNEEELKKLNDEINKQGKIEFDIQD